MRRTAVIVGAPFWISNLATLVGSLISGPIPNAPNSLTTMYPHATVIVVGTLIAHINDAAIIGYAVLLFPVLKRYGEGLALGYVAFKGWRQRCSWSAGNRAARARRSCGPFDA